MANGELPGKTASLPGLSILGEWPLWQSRPVGALKQRGAVEEKRTAGFDGQAACASADHGFHRGDADYRYVEAHVLVGFGDFDDGEAAGEN